MVNPFDCTHHASTASGNDAAACHWHTQQPGSRWHGKDHRPSHHQGRTHSPAFTSRSYPHARPHSPPRATPVPPPKPAAVKPSAARQRQPPRRRSAVSRPSAPSRRPRPSAARLLRRQRRGSRRLLRRQSGGSRRQRRRGLGRRPSRTPLQRCGTRPRTPQRPPRTPSQSYGVLSWFLTHAAHRKRPGHLKRRRRLHSKRQRGPSRCLRTPAGAPRRWSCSWWRPGRRRPRQWRRCGTRSRRSRRPSGRWRRCCASDYDADYRCGTKFCEKSSEKRQV